MNDTQKKFMVLREDIESAAHLAAELKQNTLASVLWQQLAAIALAQNGRIDEALIMMREMAEACCKISEKYIR